MGPQTKATIWNSVFTFALLLVTGCYAWFTLEMTNSINLQLELTRKQYRISYRPYIYFGKFELDPKEFEGFKYRIIMENSGLVPAKVKIEKYCVNKEDNCFKEDDFSYIYPNSDGTNIGAVGSMTEIKKYIESNKEFKLIFKLRYWSIDDTEMLNPYIFEKTIRIFKDPNNPSNFLHESLNTNAS